MLYKLKFEDRKARILTDEAEFTAAVVVEKYILCVQSILKQIGIPQNETTKKITMSPSEW
jgi:hypothetical protein